MWRLHQAAGSWFYNQCLDAVPHAAGVASTKLFFNLLFVLLLSVPDASVEIPPSYIVGLRIP